MPVRGAAFQRKKSWSFELSIPGHSLVSQASPINLCLAGQLLTIPSALPQCSPRQVSQRVSSFFLADASKLCAISLLQTTQHLLTHQTSWCPVGALLHPSKLHSYASCLAASILNADPGLPVWPHTWHYPFWKSYVSYPGGSTASLQERHGCHLAIVIKTILSYIFHSPNP